MSIINNNITLNFGEKFEQNQVKNCLCLNVTNKKNEIDEYQNQIQSQFQDVSFDNTVIWKLKLSDIQNLQQLEDQIKEFSSGECEYEFKHQVTSEELIICIKFKKQIIENQISEFIDKSKQYNKDGVNIAISYKTTKDNDFILDHAKQTKNGYYPFFVQSQISAKIDCQQETYDHFIQLLKNFEQFKNLPSNTGGIGFLKTCSELAKHYERLSLLKGANIELNFDSAQEIDQVIREKCQAVQEPIPQVKLSKENEFLRSLGNIPGQCFIAIKDLYIVKSTYTIRDYNTIVECLRKKEFL